MTRSILSSILLLALTGTTSFAAAPETRRVLDDVEEVAFAVRRPGNNGHYYVSWGRSVGGVSAGEACYGKPG